MSCEVSERALALALLLLYISVQREQEDGLHGCEDISINMMVPYERVLSWRPFLAYGPQPFVPCRPRQKHSPLINAKTQAKQKT